MEVSSLRKGVSDPLDLRQLLLFLITNVSKRLHLENISFILHDPDSGDYELKESITLTKSVSQLVETSPLVQYFHSKQDLIFLSKIKHFISKHERRASSKKANIDVLKALASDMEKIQAEVAVPFMNQKTLTGILSIGSKKTKRKFDEREIHYIKSIAEEFLPLIQSAVLYEELRNREREISSLYEVGKAISSLHDFKKIFDVIARNTSILLKAPKILILLFDDYSARFVIKKSFGFTDFQISKLESLVRFKECTQILAQKAEGILIKEPQDNTLYEDSIFSDLGIHSIMAIPLFDEDMTIIGELRTMRPPSQKPFTDRELDIATNLSNNIMVALNNSTIYQKSEEHLMELTTTYNITKSLTSEFELDKILKKVCSIFTEVLSFSRAILYEYTTNNLLIPRVASGWSEDIYRSISLDISKTIEGKALLEGRILQITPKQLETYDRTAVDILGLSQFVVVPLLIVNKKPIGVLVIDLGDDTVSQDNFKPRLLTSIAHQAAVIIENARLYKESEALNEKLKKEQTRTAKELQMARYIQQGLLSAKLPENKALSIFATNIPCRAVGGDFYNFIPYDESNLGVVVGDVSGKGIPAALLMTMTNSIFTEFGKRFASPETILQATNQSLQGYLSRSPIFYVTAFYAMINFERNLLRYCKAGHNPPILYRSATEDCFFLDTEGTYLGTFDDGGFIEKNMVIRNGDKLILYTDGITEVRNNRKQLFAKERLASLVRSNPTLAPDKLAKFLIGEVERFGDYHEFSDDITLVVIDFQELPVFKETNRYKLDYTLKSKLPAVKKTIADFLKKLEALDISKRIHNHIRLSFSECLLNAMEHGNKNDPKKNIQVTGVITNRKIEVSIADEGQGFNLGTLNYSENQTDITNRGRGITAMQACMDEVLFNDSGNVVTLIKYLI